MWASAKGAKAVTTVTIISAARGGEGERCERRAWARVEGRTGEGTERGGWLGARGKQKSGRHPLRRRLEVLPTPQAQTREAGSVVVEQVAVYEDAVVELLN